MKGRWICLLMVTALLLAGFKPTEDEEPKETQKTTNIKSEQMELNLLRKEAIPELSEVVQVYYEVLADENGFVESYSDVTTYTKLGKYTDTYVVYVTYQMKIKDQYTSVPGLGTLYATYDRVTGKYHVEDTVEDDMTKAYVVLLLAHADVRDLFAQVQANYEATIRSDALLLEALTDLQTAVSQ